MVDDVLLNKAATIERCVLRAREVFALLAQAGPGWPDRTTLAEGLQRMVGFRNIAVHDCQSLQLPITVAIIEKHLEEFLQYSKALLLRDAG